MYEDSNIAGSPDIEALELLEDSGKLQSFLETIFEDSKTRYAAFSFPVDTPDPLAYLEMRWQQTAFHYYWEKPSDEFAIAAGNELLKIESSGENRFQEIHSRFEDIKRSTAEFSAISHPYAGMFLLGGFSFFDEVTSDLWQSFAPATFSVPRWMIIQSGKLSFATFAVQLSEFDGPDDLTHYLHEQLENVHETITRSTENRSEQPPTGTLSNTPDIKNSEYNKWTSSLERAKDLIKRNKFKKIVLARHVTVAEQSTIAPTQILNRLRQQFTSCYNFLYHNSSGDTFVGSTPERLGTFRNQLFLTEALAGSIKRGDTATEDAILAKHLASSNKNMNEHRFVVKDIENRLHQHVSSLNRNSDPEIKKLSNVQHLYTPVRAKLKEESTILEIIGQLHPTPAVGGYPWQQAAPYLKELEDFDRGWYAAPVGWIDRDLNGQFSVAIRSAVAQDKRVWLYAGAGIVADSQPESEWDETALKFIPMLNALGVE